MATRTMTTDSLATLRLVLQADAAFSAVSGALTAAAAGPLAALFGLDTATPLTVIGLGLVLYGLWLYRTASREADVRPLGLLVAILNTAWVVASVALLLGNWLPLTENGRWVIAAVTAAVDLFGTAQFYLLWRMRQM